MAGVLGWSEADVAAFEFAWSEDDLELRFALPSGTFATAVLRELMQLEQTSRRD